MGVICMDIKLLINGKEVAFQILHYEKKLRLFMETLEHQEKTPEVNDLLKKALMEKRNLFLFTTGVVNEKFYRTFLETKDFSNYLDTEAFLKFNEYLEFPMLYMFNSAGLPFERILKCLGKTKADLILEMRMNGFSGNYIDIKEVILTTMCYHDYNKIGFYEESPKIAEEFAKAMLAKRIFRSKISMLLNMPFHLIENLN